MRGFFPSKFSDHQKQIVLSCVTINKKNFIMLTNLQETVSNHYLIQDSNIKKYVDHLLTETCCLVTHYKIWFLLGWLDIKQRYVGSLLGPLWITFNMCILLTAFSLIYSRLLHQDLAHYIPYLCSGLLIWTYISAIFIESGDMFCINRIYIHQIRLPFLVYLYRIICRNTIILLHNSVVLLVVIFYFKIHITWNTLLIIPGYFLVTLQLLLISLLIGMLGARFRDIPPILTSFIQVLFFVSPITWIPNLIGENSMLIRANPITYFMDLTRSPLLGIAPALRSWEIIIAMIVCSLIIIIPIFLIKRRQIPFWI